MFIWKANSADFNWKRPVGVFSTSADRRCGLVLVNQMSLKANVCVSVRGSLLEKQKQINTHQHTQIWNLKNVIKTSSGKGKVELSKQKSALSWFHIESLHQEKPSLIVKKDMFCSWGMRILECMELSAELRTRRNLPSLCSRAHLVWTAVSQCCRKHGLWYREHCLCPALGRDLACAVCDPLPLCQWGLCRTAADGDTLLLERCCNLSKNTKW